MTPSSPNYQSCRESRCGSEKGEGVNQKKEEPKQTKEESVALGILLLGGLWLLANHDSVGQALDKARTVVWSWSWSWSWSVWCGGCGVGGWAVCAVLVAQVVVDAAGIRRVGR